MKGNTDRGTTGIPRAGPCLQYPLVGPIDVRCCADANYKRFITACPGLCWSVDLQGAGHLQFLDMQVGWHASWAYRAAVAVTDTVEGAKPGIG